jgi:hypothetical protein
MIKPIQAGGFSVVKKIIILELILASLLNIPYTGAGKASVAQVQAVLNKSPKGFPVPPLIPINTYDTLGEFEKGLVGDWSMYHKKPGTKQQVLYPVHLKNTDHYFYTVEKDPLISCDNFPYAFVSTNDTGKVFTPDPQHPPSSIKILSYDPSHISIEAKMDTTAFLVLQQAYYPHWTYKNEQVREPVEKAGIAFIRAPLYTGSNLIRFDFNPVFVKWMMLLSLAAFMILCLLFFILPAKQVSPS